MFEAQINNTTSIALHAPSVQKTSLGSMCARGCAFVIFCVHKFLRDESERGALGSTSGQHCACNKLYTAHTARHEVAEPLHQARDSDLAAAQFATILK